MTTRTRIPDIPNPGELLSIGAALCWAWGVILFKRAGESMSALALNLFKGAVGLLFLTPLVHLTGGDLLPDQPWSSWVVLMASGFLGIAVADTMFFLSLEHLGAGLTAVVDTSYTPIILGLSYLWLGERLGSLDLVGAALIASGLLVGSVAPPPKGKARRDVWIGGLIGIGGITTMGFSLVMIKPLLNDLPVLWSTWVRLLAGTGGVLVLMLIHPRRRGFFRELRPASTWRWAVPASFLGTFLATSLWIGGMKYTEVSRAALLNQLSTIFIFVLASIVLHEPLTWRRTLAVILAVAGAALVVL